jgi:ubiquinone/menaquinone biosynthesis C-methylase UbiE
MGLLLAMQAFLKEGIQVTEYTDYLEVPIINPSKGIVDNAYYFNNREWAVEYLKYCHRSETFRKRWSFALGDIIDKVVVDIGCGPGNIFATLEVKPKLLIGVDVAATSLQIAKTYNYLPLLADASDLPFISGFADVVTLNATLHHCENMETVLREAARIVKPGGIIVTDHDPQLNAWDYKGVAKLLWISRLLIYKIMKHGFHKSNHQQLAALASEIHHKPGHGVTRELFINVLSPLGFSTNLYPHNHDLGDEIFQGIKGKAAFKYRVGNFLSGRHPTADTSALSLMCIARKTKT